MGQDVVGKGQNFQPKISGCCLSDILNNILNYSVAEKNCTAGCLKKLGFWRLQNLSGCCARDLISLTRIFQNPNDTFFNFHPL